MSQQYYTNIVPMTDTKDLFVRIGFAPDIVRLTNLYTGSSILWSRAAHGNTGGTAASGGLFYEGYTGGFQLLSTNGVVLCEFTEPVEDLTHGGSDPAIVNATEFWKANGIKIASTSSLLETDKMLLVEAWRANNLWLKAVHDGTTSNATYFEDQSYDFKKLGVSGNGGWIIVNQSNGNYAYIKSVKKGGTQGKHCRIYTATDADGTATTAADFDTGDICFLLPTSACWYPMSDIGIMT